MIAFGGRRGPHRSGSRCRGRPIEGREAGREGCLWPNAASQGRPPDGSGGESERSTQNGRAKTLCGGGGGAHTNSELPQAGFPESGEVLLQKNNTPIWLKRPIMFAAMPTAPLPNLAVSRCVSLTRSLCGCLLDRPFSSAAMGSPLFQEWLHLVGEEVVAEEPAPMGPDDALIIIDMQRDFVPGDPVRNPSGGRFGVAEGDHVCPVVVQLIDAAASAGATIGATRDYHPHDHKSFVPQGGPFPPHCVQGTVGARFMPQIAAALARALAQGGLEGCR